MNSGGLNNNKAHCSFCLKLVNKNTLRSCKYDEEFYCCISNLCKECYDTHMKAHQKNEGYINYLLNSWKNGECYIPKGNKMGLF